MKIDIYGLEKKVFNRTIKLSIIVKAGKKIEDLDIDGIEGELVHYRNTFNLKRKDQRYGILDCGIVYDEIKENGYFFTDPIFCPCSAKEELHDLLTQAIQIIENMGVGELIHEEKIIK